MRRFIPAPCMLLPFALVAFAPTGRAADAALARSITQTVAMAVNYSATVMAQAQEATIAEGVAAVARGLTQPRLESGVSHRHQEGEPATGVSVARLAVVQPLYRGGLVAAEKARASYADSRATLLIEAAHRSVARDARQAYCRLLLARRLLEVSETQTDIAHEYLQSTQSRLDRGLVNERELLRAEVELANQEADRLRAVNAAHIESINLQRLTGLSESTAIELTDSLTDMDRWLAVSNAAAQVQARHRLEVQQAQLDATGRVHRVEALLARRRPQLSLEGGLQGETDWDGFTEDSWQVTFALDLPLFDQPGLRGELVQEVARLRRDSLLADDIYRDALRAVLTARANLTSATQRAAQSEDTVSKAEAFLKGEEQRLERGNATYLDVLNARGSLARAQRDYYRALYDMAAARIELMLSQADT